MSETNNYDGFNDATLSREAGFSFSCTDLKKNKNVQTFDLICSFSSVRFQSRPRNSVAEREEFEKSRNFRELI